MQTLSILLADVSFPLLQEGFTIAGGWFQWLTELIRALIEGVGITGVGIILFTLILKAITLPFDVYQRVTMRKQTLIMRRMAPELEKLQKQYANDRNTYSAKMMELYKKNGYNMFGACLPMIISLVILIIAFQSLNEFSQYANLAMYERMTASYNAAVRQYSVSEEEAAADEITTEERAEGTFIIVKSSQADKFVYFEYNADEKDANGEQTKRYSYKIDVDKMYAYFGGDSGEIAALVEEERQNDASYTKEDGCYAYLNRIGAKAAAQSYRDDPPSFLWIKNIWYPDVSYAHPIQEYQEFVNSIRAELIWQDGTRAPLSEVLDEALYENITSQLDSEKEEPNGYFVLIILSIGLIVLSQFVSMRSSKESSQFQTVDGSGAKQQKMMMVIMPIIYAIFAFMYSAAFSLYMLMSSVISILVTLGSNFVIGRIFRKKEEEEIRQRHTRTVPGRKPTDRKKK